ncbi:hypothetical protein AYO40_00255 [Planctomycetaceae bacterium SCGC AG-212-D15]|nr:hypothetical protein AYO40_00255 [Planctomycetaceae bacterium SCGC AG-212-D15]
MGWTPADGWARIGPIIGVLESGCKNWLGAEIPLAWDVPEPRTSPAPRCVHEDVPMKQSPNIIRRTLSSGVQVIPSLPQNASWVEGKDSQASFD